MHNTKSEIMQIPLYCNEFWYLISHYSPTYVLGIENPYSGWLAAEIEEANTKAALSLQEKGFIHILNNRNIEVDQVIASVAYVCSHPQHTLIIQSQKPDGTNQQQYVYIYEEWIIRNIELEPGKLSLTIFRDHQAFFHHIQANLHRESKVTEKNTCFLIPEELFMEASNYYARKDFDAGFGALQSVGLDKSQIVRLAELLSHPVENTSFTAVLKQQDPKTQQVRGFGVLEGRQDTWIMRRITKNNDVSIEFISADADMIQKRFEELLP